MSAGPPPYPRIGHLIAGRGTSDDVDVAAVDWPALFEKPVLVEEKLDGANVALWLDGGTIRCATRSGIGGQDRAGQLGPLRAWAAQRYATLVPLLADGTVLYGEWLLLRHSVGYDELPDHLVVLDLWRDGRFAIPDERDERLVGSGLVTPPALFRGVIGSLARLERLLAGSRVGPEPMEGAVVRTLDGSAPRVAKLVRAGFTRIEDDQWRGGRPRNVVAPPPPPTSA